MSTNRLIAWTLAKYVLALAGIALILYSNNSGQRWLGHLGIGLVAVGFILRFFYRVPRRPEPPA